MAQLGLGHSSVQSERGDQIDVVDAGSAAMSSTCSMTSSLTSGAA